MGTATAFIVGISAGVALAVVVSLLFLALRDLLRDYVYRIVNERGAAWRDWLDKRIANHTHYKDRVLR